MRSTSETAPTRYRITGIKENETVSQERATIEEAREVALDLTKRGFRMVGIDPRHEAA